MSTKILLASDFHLTDRPEDEYRWKVFDVLDVYVESQSIDHLFILGDLTEEKDYHSAELVIRLTKRLHNLSTKTPISIIKGNHDYRDSNEAFFSFLSIQSQGWRNRCEFYSAPDHVDVEGSNVVLVPHFHKWEDVSKKVVPLLHDANLVLCHQTFDKAKSESGRELKGPSSKVVTDHVQKGCLVICGDVHTPQDLDRVTYLGSPHPVDYGDEFDPRIAIGVAGDKSKNFRMAYHNVTTIKKVIIRGDVEQCSKGLKKLVEGDRCKLVVEMQRSDIGEWPDISRKLKKACEDRGVFLASIEPVVSAPARQKQSKAQVSQLSNSDLFDRYCKINKIDDQIAETGRQLLSVAKDQS